MYRIHEIKCRPGEDLQVIPQRIREKLKKPGMELSEWRIVKESIDARDKSNIRMVYSVDFLPSDPKIRLPLDKAEAEQYTAPER